MILIIIDNCITHVNSVCIALEYRLKDLLVGEGVDTIG